jgi:hypothetical protein
MLTGMKTSSLRMAALALCFLASGCGGQTAQAPAGNDSQRTAAQIQKQEQAIRNEAESNTSAIEQALENESAIVFENRGNLLNEAAPDNAAAPAPAASNTAR